MCVPPQVRAEAGWANEVLDVCGRGLGVGEVNGAWHRLQADGVVVHLHRCEYDGVGPLVGCPPGGRLYRIEVVRARQLMLPFRAGIGILSL